MTDTERRRVQLRQEIADRHAELRHLERDPVGAPQPPLIREVFARPTRGTEQAQDEAAMPGPPAPHNLGARLRGQAELMHQEAEQLMALAKTADLLDDNSPAKAALAAIFQTAQRMYV